MKVIGIFLSTLLVTIQANQPISCDLRTNRDFSLVQPLVLKKIEGSNEYEFDYPDIGDSLLFERNENILLACPGTAFNQTISKTVINVQCVEETNFRVYNKTEVKPFEDYDCLRLPQSTLERNGKCAIDNGSAIKVGFRVSNEIFVKIIDICFDEKLNSALYSKHKIMPFIEGSQKYFKRKSFMQGDFFPHISANDAYTRENQMEIFSDQSESWKNDHINPRQYVARGHFSPMGDFVYGSQQTATFYFTNVAPQWQSFNGGNWSQLESSIRKLSINNRLELTIYTGTYGIYELDGIKRYLTNGDSNNPTIPIPLIFWKVAYDEKRSKAVAVIGLNDPDPNPADNPAKDMCTDVCTSIKWLKLIPKPSSGLIYCCTVKELTKIVTILPPIAADLDKLSLLDDELVKNSLSPKLSRTRSKKT